MAIKIFNAGAYREMMSRIDDKATRDRLAHAAMCVQGLMVARDAFCPAYPNLRGKPSAQLALGLAKPVDLCPGMTSKEAHEVLSDLSPDFPVRDHGDLFRHSLEWMMARLVGGEEFHFEGWAVQRYGPSLSVEGVYGQMTAAIYPRDTPTVRWLAAVLRDPERLSALLREREGRGPHGERYTYRLVERADEIDQRDLAEGESTGVVTAFERAAERMIEDHVKEYGDDPLADPPEWWTPLPGARLLLTARELAIEGREMRHCVSGYAPYVKAGRSVIVALNIAGERSTVEFDRSGRVRQHRGIRNAQPGKTGRDVLKLMIAAWRISKINEPAQVRMGRAMVDPFQHVVQGLAAMADEVRDQAGRLEVLVGHRHIGHAPRDIAEGELMRVTLPPVDPITYIDTPSAAPSPFWAAYQRGIANTEDDGDSSWVSPASTEDIMATLDAARDLMALDDTPFNPREVPSPFHSPDMPHYMANPLYRPGGIYRDAMKELREMQAEHHTEILGVPLEYLNGNTEDA